MNPKETARSTAKQSAPGKTDAHKVPAAPLPVNERTEVIELLKQIADSLDETNDLLANVCGKLDGINAKL